MTEIVARAATGYAGAGYLTVLDGWVELRSPGVDATTHDEREEAIGF